MLIPVCSPCKTLISLSFKILSKYFPTSTPIHFRFILWATAQVVPLPAKKSNTRLPCSLLISKIRLNKRSGFLPFFNFTNPSLAIPAHEISFQKSESNSVGVFTPSITLILFE